MCVCLALSKVRTARGPFLHLCNSSGVNQVVLRHWDLSAAVAALTFEIRDQRRRRRCDYSTGNDLSHLTPSPSVPPTITT